MPRLAIVIPATGTAESLETTLLAVLENRPQDCEVIAVTNFAYADPYDLADEVRFVTREQADAIACTGVALTLARSSVIHVLGAGCQVAEGWADQALDHFSDLSVAAVAPVVLHVARRDQVLAAGIEYRAGGGRRVRVKKLQRLTAVGPTSVFGVSSQAAFFRRSALEAVGGWTSELGPNLADVELAWAFRRAGYRTVVEPAAHVYSPGLSSAPVGAFREGLYAERLFWRRASQAGWLTALAAHAWLVGCETLAHLPQPNVVARLAGRFCGIADVRYHLRQAQHPVAPSPEAGDVDRLPMAEHLRLDREHPPRSGSNDRRSSRRMHSA